MNKEQKKEILWVTIISVLVLTGAVLIFVIGSNHNKEMINKCVGNYSIQYSNLSSDQWIYTNGKCYAPAGSYDYVGGHWSYFCIKLNTGNLC